MNTDVLLNLLAREVFGNSVEAYLVSLAIFLGVVLGLRVIKSVVVKRLRELAKRTATDIDDFLIGLLRHIGPAVYFFLALYLATRSLVLPVGLQNILRILFVIVVTIKGVQILQEVATFFMQKWAAREQQEDPTAAAAIGNMVKVVQVVLWVGAVVFVLDNLGINVTAVVAGLGIGGVAVALAAQSVLGDAFSSFAIFVDKPFRVGDFIIVGDLLGTIEHVGFKTTRIRSLHGEQLIFSNSDLTSSRIRNYKQMQTRRIAFQIGVTYQTTTEQVREIPKIVERVVKEHEMAKLDRAHFKSYGDFALIFEIVYYVLSPDYNKYMDVQQYINVRLKEEFEKQGIDFAYPTQQLYLTKVEPPA